MFQSSHRERPSLNHKNWKRHNWLIYDTYHNLLISHSNLIKGDFNDLGCGEMPFKDWLLLFADTYAGVDWSSSLHDLTADILSDLNEPLAIDNDVADTVISLSLMEHLREPQVFLSEAHRILKPGGGR